MFWNIATLAVKELLAILRDKRSRFVLIGPPLIQLLVFGYAASFDLDHIPVALYNEDGGGAARELVARIEGSPHFEIVARPDRDAAVAPLIDNREALLALHIGPRVSAGLERGTGAPVQAILDGRNSNTAMIALNYLRDIVLAFNRDWPPATAARAHRRCWRCAPGTTKTCARAGSSYPASWALLTLVVTLVVTALSVVREQEQGTFDQLLVTPLRPVEILAGKALPGLLVGALEASLIIALAVFWFDIPLRGSLGALYLGLGLFLLSAVGIGLMISAICVTQQQAVLGAFLFLVPAVILSGFATPIANMPDAVQVLTYIDPLRYFLVVVRGVFLEGDGYALLLHQYWPMAIIGIVSLALAGWLFRHRMY